MLYVCLLYQGRAVQKLWLMKGGYSVQLQTFSILPNMHTVIVPTQHVSCLKSRFDVGSSIPMKIKNRSFFFILDKNGNFHDTDLFDYIIGLSRS